MRVQIPTLALHKLNYNKIVLFWVAPICISTIEKTEIVNSLHVVFEKELQLSSITFK